MVSSSFSCSRNAVHGIQCLLSRLSEDSLPYPVLRDLNTLAHSKLETQSHSRKPEDAQKARQCLLSSTLP